MLRFYRIMKFLVVMSCSVCYGLDTSSNIMVINDYSVNRRSNSNNEYSLNYFNAKNKNACGPIALYITYQYSGKTSDISLEDIIKDLGGREKDEHSLYDLYVEARNMDLDASMKHMSPKDLYGCLATGNYVFVLPVRKYSNEINHFIAVLRNIDDNNLLVVDYPELIQKWDNGYLIDVWDGDALVINISPKKFSFSNIVSHIRDNIGKTIFCICTISIVICFLRKALRHSWVCIRNI